MSFESKVQTVLAAKADMDSSKIVCVEDALRLHVAGVQELANARLEKAAQYCWGFNRPKGW